MEIIRYRLVQKLEDGSFTKTLVDKLEFKPDTLQVYANEKLVDGNRAEVVRSSNSFDIDGTEIWQSDYLEDEDKQIYEVMSACGSLFILKDEEPTILTLAITMRLKVIGNVFEDTERLFPIPSEVVDGLNEAKEDEGNN